MDRGRQVVLVMKEAWIEHLNAVDFVKENKAITPVLSRKSASCGIDNLDLEFSLMRESTINLVVSRFFYSLLAEFVVQMLHSKLGSKHSFIL